MKILLVTDLYPLENEHISKVLLNFARSWIEAGHTITVIRPNFMLNTIIRGRKIIKEKLYEEQGIKIYNLNFVTPFWFNVRRKLPRDFSLKNYDVMISHMPSGSLFAQQLLKKEKIKYICAVHASDITVLKDFKYALYFRQALKNAYLSADKIAARSPVLEQKIKQIIPETKNKTFTAFSGIKKTLKTPDSLSRFYFKTLKIYSAASLIKRKNIDIVLKALSMLKTDFKYTISGTGPEYNNLKKAAEKLKISDKVHFTGGVTQEEVFNNMLKSGIFVLLSSSETFGLVYLEAMKAGCIVIAKRNDGIDGILKDGQNAFLINADSIELKDCLEKILNMEEAEINRMRAEAVKTAEKFSEKAAADNYLHNIS